jgi:hypothetical protein
MAGVQILYYNNKVQESQKLVEEHRSQKDNWIAKYD